VAAPAVHDAIRDVVHRLCRPGTVQSVVQPIIRSADQLIVGYECLARMPGEPFRPPDWWLARAEETGLRSELEIACLAAAAELGEPPDNRLLFVNLSPSLLANPGALALLDRLPERLVVELTEQEGVDDYDRVRHDLEPWLARGVRVAVDDTGAGYSSLRHVIELTPDFLKLDRELVRGIDADRNRRALVGAMVAFAAEVGTSVVAEGVETDAEFAVLRDAEVDLVQGYLLARPAAPWPEARSHGRRVTISWPRSWGEGSPAEHRLAQALDRAGNSRQACAAVVEHLFRLGQVMPSAYLERHGELRCIAQRGLWQVLDGMSASAGITGRTWKTGRSCSVPNVSENPHYLQATPGVVSEICVPIRIGTRTVGALNVESLVPIQPGMLVHLERCSELLAKSLEDRGDPLEEATWGRTVRASVALTGIPDDARLPAQVLQCLLDASAMDSGAVIVDGPEGRAVEAVAGPLGEALTGLASDELDSMSALVDAIRSCYTGSDPLGRGFVGSESLRAAGARSVLVLPLWAKRARFGSVVLAHSRPMRLSSEEVRPLETLADHAAAVLASRLRATVNSGAVSEWDGLVERRRSTASIPAPWDRRARKGNHPSESTRTGSVTDSR
jgi:EAL domain-containing protein (putative c-di-GMP-specific phosphodiesterase class I)/putative methionine-R-sulfoxide reductase with GAF domain